MKDGRAIDDALMKDFLDQEIGRILAAPEADRYAKDAAALFESFVMAPALEEFLTTKAYDMVLAYEKEAAPKALRA